jgi:non-heme chloroperoxidase
MKTATLALVLSLATLSVAQATPPKSGFFTTSDRVRIHYLEAGRGPALVFIPGWAMPAIIWEKQIAHFAPRYHVVAVDPRAQGESDKATDGLYPERRARDYKELCDHLKLSAPVLVGWSMGVAEILTYAEQFGPASVRGLVLVDGFLWTKPDPQMGTQAWQWMHGLQRERQKSTEGFVRSLYKKPQSEEYLRRVTEASLQTPTNSAVVLIHNFFDREDWTPVLAKLAEAGTPLLGVYTAQVKNTVELLRARVPGAKLEIFEDAGHALFVDDTERFNRVLEEFLATIK